MEYKLQFENLKEMEQKRSAQELLLFHKEIEEKNVYIIKLEKEVGYLSALLKEWKPVEQP
jgi:hypothetical protein